MAVTTPDIAFSSALINNVIVCIRRSSAQLRDVSRFSHELRNVPEVQDAYAKFSGRWQNHRSELSAVLDGWASSLEEALAQMTAVDAKLANKLKDAE